MTPVYPITAFVEEVSFNLAALASRVGPTIDTRDWMGSTQPDFGTDRKFGFPWLEGGVLAPGAIAVNVQVGVPTFPIAEPPVLAFTTWQTIAAAGGAPTPISIRLPWRFARLQFVDTTNAANNGIYGVFFLRGA